MDYQPQLFQIQPLPIDFLHSLPEAAKTTIPSSHVSKRYGHIRSDEILGDLVGLGFEILNVKAGKSRFGAHIMNLRHPGISIKGDGVASDRKLELQFAVQNSHDGTTNYSAALQLRDQQTGEEFTLNNGWSTVRVRHNIHVAKGAPEATLRLGDAAPQVLTMLEALEVANVSQTELIQFASHAVKARWGERSPILETDLLEGLDEGCTVWKALCHIQAKILNGGIKTIRNSKTRRVRPPSERMRIQQAIWKIAESIALGREL
jgi:hypothetical protein